MIETPEGVANASAIASVEGIDAVFVGPNDLSYAMGFANDWNAAPVQAAMEVVIRAVAAAGKCAGLLSLSPNDEEKYAAWGARYFANVRTSIITDAFRQAAQGGYADKGVPVALKY